jgi:hypothetical protein
LKEEKFGAIFWLHLLPMMLITTALEGLGLAHWGKWQPAYKTIKHYSIHGTLVYEAGQFVLNLGMILVCARLVQVLGRTFHGRITYTYPRSLAVVVYGLSPMFLLRLLDPFAGMNPYVTWGLGILLSIWVLYDGLPRLLMPDPTHAFGLYLSCAFVLLLATGLVRLVTGMYLQGNAGFANSAMGHALLQLMGR